MAVISPVRPKWMRREKAVVYVANGQMRVRSRAEKIRNPRTAAQQSNRRKMGVAAQFLRHMQPMASRGFDRGRKRNGREVGAYHVALGALLREGMRKESEGWAVDYPQVRLSEGRSLEGYPLEAGRRGGVLALSFPKGLPRGVRTVRIALYCPRSGRALHYTLADLQAGRGASFELGIPKWARGITLHIWWMAEGAKGARWESQYLLLARGRGGIPTRITGTKGAMPPIVHPGTKAIERVNGAVGGMAKTISNPLLFYS